MRNWYQIIKLADYEDYQEKVEQAYAKNPRPFKDWFGPDGRVFFPFNAPPMDDQYKIYDYSVFKLLGEMGCEVTDYRAGLCSKGGRQYRIGRLIEQFFGKQMKEMELEINNLEQQMKQSWEQNPGDFTTPMRLDIQIDNLRAKYETLKTRQNATLNRFNESEFRQGRKQGLQVVISDNPKDIAMMSTERRWRSCMNIEDGMRKENVYCELEGGGLVAYLVVTGDNEVENPISRIHIRRFSNQNGHSMAIPENRVYGRNVPGFQQQVQAWIDSKQSQMKQEGIWTLQGGQASDTLDNIIQKFPEDLSGLLDYFWKAEYLTPGEDKRYINYVKKKAAQKILNLNENVDMSIISEIKNFGIQYAANGGDRDLLYDVDMHYPDAFNEEDIEGVPQDFQSRIIRRLPLERKMPYIKERITGEGIPLMEVSTKGFLDTISKYLNNPDGDIDQDKIESATNKAANDIVYSMRSNIEDLKYLMGNDKIQRDVTESLFKIYEQCKAVLPDENILWVTTAGENYKNPLSTIQSQISQYLVISEVTPEEVVSFYGDIIPKMTEDQKNMK